MGKNLDEAVTRIEKQFGQGAIFLMGSKKIVDVPAISTSCLSLDRALGIGGIPRGRVIEIFGPESCLSADTFIQYETRSCTGIRKNHKGGTIERLYERFHHKNTHHLEHTNSEFFAPSVNEQGRIVSNKILDVIDTGFQNCFKITTEKGFTIEATSNELFYTTDSACSLNPNRYDSLDTLEVGQKIYIHNNTPFSKEHKKSENRYEYFVKNHPFAPNKKVSDGKGNSYNYKRLLIHRAIVEAEANNMPVEEYIEYLNTHSTFYGMIFLSPEFHIHHIDEDINNNQLSNLMVVSASDHGKLHAKERHNNLRFTIVEDIIKSIESIGIKHTYDLKMQYPYNNYIANHFVVHNSGKTTICLQIIAEAQVNYNLLAAYVDAEHALDKPYATKLGVRVNELLVSQPSCGEEALEITESLIRSNEVGIVVVDSVAALVPRAELNGEMGDSHMGLQARLMSQAMRKLTAIVAKSDTSLIFINQLRDKIGVMFGSPEITSGGRALKFYASVRIDIRRISAIKDGEAVIGARTKIKVVKNKCAAPFQEVEVDLIYGEGISKERDLIDLAVEFDVINKSGSWFSFKGERLGQGLTNTANFLKGEKELTEQIRKETWEHLSQR